MKELGILGGYFSPIHTQHLILGRWAQFRHNLDKVLVMPSGQPPHKKSHYLDRELRYAMVCAAVADDAVFEPSRLEIDRPGVTWTIDTLIELKRIYGPDVRLNFICGEDNIKALVRYDRRDEFLSLCRLLVGWRGTDGAEKLAQWRAALPGADIELVDCPASDLSSTFIRELIAAGKPYRYLVPEAVYRLIEERLLYRDSANSASPASCSSICPQPVVPLTRRSLSSSQRIAVALLRGLDQAYTAVRAALQRRIR